MRSNLQKCVGLRMAGATYESIAAQLKLPLEEVERLVEQGVSALSTESPEMRARLELARLDALLMGIWSQAQRGDTAAVGQALKIIGHRTAVLSRLDGANTGGAGESVEERVAWLKTAVNES